MTLRVDIGRSPVLIAGLLALSSGCFSEPSEVGDATGGTSNPTTTGSADTGEETTTTATVSTTAVSQTTTTDASSSDSTSGSTDFVDSSSGDDDDTDNPEPPFCDCPPGDLLLCEDFEVPTDQDAFPYAGWTAPSGSEPFATTADAPCGNLAYSGVVETQTFSVIGHNSEDINEVAEPGTVEIGGLMRITPGCAANDPHYRVLSMRFGPTAGGFTFAIHVDADDAGGLEIRREGGPATPIVSGPAFTPNTWQRIALRYSPGIAASSHGELQVGPTSVPFTWNDALPLSENADVSALLGPALPTDSFGDGSCTVDFDQFHVLTRPPE